jgi:hypothetical protein
VVCSQRGAVWTTKAVKGRENLLAGKAPFRVFRRFRDLRVPNPFPHASDVLAILGSGSSAQRGVACSQRGAVWTTKAAKGRERHENLLAGKAPFRVFRALS